MTRLAHLSDLHFGTDAPGLAVVLADRLRRIAPDLVIVSGDLTQRARPSQFRAARAFLDGLGLPWLAVPGNHDIPLYMLPERLIRPFARYRRHISDDLEPGWADGAVQVQGVNSVNPRTWQAGRLRPDDVRRTCGGFGDVDGRLRVVAMHHPLMHGPNVRKRLMEGASEALRALAGCGAEVVLCGHLHAWAAAPMRVREAGRDILLVQAGSTLSTRLRGELNDFNLLTVAGPELSVERWACGEAGDFQPAALHRFLRDGQAWQRLDEASARKEDPSPQLADGREAETAAR